VAQKPAQEGKAQQPAVRPTPAPTGPAANDLQAQFGNARMGKAVQSTPSSPMGNAAALQAGVGNARLAQALAAPKPVEQNGSASANPKPTSPVPTQETDQEAPQPEPSWALSKVAGWAKHIPGYHLLGVILGRDPISGARVPRNARNLIHGVVGLLPGGNTIYQNLEKSGAIGQAGQWFNEQIGKLGFSWSEIKRRFSRAWDALSFGDLLRSTRGFDKLKQIFLQPIKRLGQFALSAGNKLLEFILQGAMAQAGSFGKQVIAILKQAGNVFGSILSDPIGFIGNLVKALGKGFGQFSAHIWKHLKTGLMGWLFGALAGTGLQFPERLDLKGIFSLVLQILGLTWAAVRKRIVKIIGEKRMVQLERTVGFVADLANRGLVAAWDIIASTVGNLKDWILGAIQNWVVTRIVKSAVVKLVSMFNPAGAIIQAALAIYNTIMFFIERAQQIAALAQSVFSSIGKIAAGAVVAAANFIELSMARTLPVIISFLARLLGLGGIGEKVRGVIKKIQQPIINAIGRVVDFVVRKASGLFGKKGRQKKDNDNLNSTIASRKHDKMVEEGLVALHIEEAKIDKDKNDTLSFEEAQTVAKSTKKRFPVFSLLEAVDGGTRWDYDYEASPKTREKSHRTKAFSSAVSTPNWRRVAIDMEHIMTRHATGGAETANRNLWPDEMTEADIEKVVRFAYRDATRESSTLRGDQVRRNILLNGTTTWQGNVYVVEMFYSPSERKIETAWWPYGRLGP